MHLKIFGEKYTMVKEIKKNDKEYFACDICGFAYAELEGHAKANFMTMQELITNTLRKCVPYAARSRRNDYLELSACLSTSSFFAIAFEALLIL